MTQSKIMVRPARSEDLVTLADLEEQAFGENAWGKEALLRELERHDAALFCALLGDQPVGYAGIRRVLDEGYVNNIAVLPEWRRQGVGTALVEALVRYGREQQLSFITLEARVSNLGAIALYQKCGFQDVGLRRGFYDFPREDARLMTLYL